VIHRSNRLTTGYITTVKFCLTNLHLSRLTPFLFQQPYPDTVI